MIIRYYNFSNMSAFAKRHKSLVNLRHVERCVWQRFYESVRFELGKLDHQTIDRLTNTVHQQ